MSYQFIYFWICVVNSYIYITGYALFRHIFIIIKRKKGNGILLVCVATVIYLVDVGKYELSVHIRRIGRRSLSCEVIILSIPLVCVAKVIYLVDIGKYVLSVHIFLDMCY